MDPLTIASIGSQALAGLGQIASGISQNAKAKKIARNNPRPEYKMPKAIVDNQNLIEGRASHGLSDGAVNTYTQASDRQQSSAIDAILKGGGSVNNIGELYSASNDGLTRLALIDEEMRSRNVKALVDQNSVMGDYQDKEWEINKWGPYADAAQAAAALKKQGSDNIWKGIGSVTGAVTNAATSKQYEEQGDNVFGNKSTQRRPEQIITEPRPYESRANTRTPTITERVRARYPGLSGSGGRVPSLENEPVWNAQMGAYVDPVTGEVI